MQITTEQYGWAQFQSGPIRRGYIKHNYIAGRDSSLTLITGDFVQGVWGRLRQCFVMLRTSLSQSIWARCRCKLSHYLHLSPITFSPRMGIFVNSFGEKKNHFSGAFPSGQPGGKTKSRNKKWTGADDIHFQSKSTPPNLLIFAYNWNSKSNIFSHFFQAAFMNKKVTVKGQQVI